jgi:nucleoside-diphosphate kinase
VAIEQTLSIVKPDAVSKNLIGRILSRFEIAGLTIVAAKLIHMNEEKAQGFYAEHVGKPFFADLMNFMCSGPILVQVLEGENAIQANRTLMGATNPEKADDDTIRKVFAESMQRNAVHGSDSPASAEREIAYFFDTTEVHTR